MTARFRATVLGVRDEAASLCEAVFEDRRYRIVAVADHDADAARRWAERLGATPYDDCRTAIVEPRPDVLFVGLPPFERYEYFQLAAGCGIATLASTPPMTNLAQAAETASLVRRSDGSLSVARHWHCEPAFVRLRGIEMLADRPFSAHVNVIAPLGNLQSWRGDAQRAVGGVLLQHAYDQTDVLVALFGMPEDVYAVLPRTTGPGDIRTHDTEDAATVMLRFPGARVATMNCRRFGNEHYWRLRIHCPRATVLMTGEQMAIHDAGLRPPSVSKVHSRNPFAPVVAAFGAALESGLAKSFSSLDDHLATLAVIEAAYLSAKTGQPESPARLYRMATGLDVQP